MEWTVSHAEAVSNLPCILDLDSWVALELLVTTLLQRLPRFIAGHAQARGSRIDEEGGWGSYCDGVAGMYSLSLIFSFLAEDSPVFFQVFR